VLRGIRDVEIYFASSSLFFVIASLTQTGAITEIALPIYHGHVEKYGKTGGCRALLPNFELDGFGRLPGGLRK
jgi:hypothetical protein